MTLLLSYNEWIPVVFKFFFHWGVIYPFHHILNTSVSEKSGAMSFVNCDGVPNLAEHIDVIKELSMKATTF
jgi:hypothetical protein